MGSWSSLLGKPTTKVGGNLRLRACSAFLAQFRDVEALMPTVIRFMNDGELRVFTRVHHSLGVAELFSHASYM